MDTDVASAGNQSPQTCPAPPHSTHPLVWQEGLDEIGVQLGVGPGGVSFIWWGEKVGCGEAQGTGGEPGELGS